MNKTKLFTIFTVLAIGLAAYGSAVNAAPLMETGSILASTGNQTYIIDTSESVIGWMGDKVVGQAHHGTIEILEGSLVVENGSLVSGSVVIDMTTIVNENLSGREAERLVSHLESDDFFSVDAYPTSTIEISSAELLENDEYAVHGDLTIKGITNPIEFVAQIVEDNGQIIAASEVVFDRTLYDVTYKSGSIFSSLGDKAINDEITITVSLVLDEA